MKRILLIFTLILLLFGCSHAPANAPETPDEPDTPAPQAPLPASSGIDWNVTVSGGGKLSRENAKNPSPVYVLQSLFPTFTQEQITPDGYIDSMVYYPVLNCLSDSETEDKLNAFIEKLATDFTENAQNAIEKVIKENPDKTLRPFIRFNMDVEAVGRYLNLRTVCYYNVSLLTPEGDVAFVDDLLHKYYEDFYCIDLYTGEPQLIEDIFYSDCDLGHLLGSALASELDYEGIELKRPFRGLPAGWRNFCLTSNGEMLLYFPTANPYTAGSITLNIPLWDLREHISIEPLDLSLFDFSQAQYEVMTSVTYLENADFSVSVEREEGVGEYLKLIPSKGNFPCLAQINEEIKQIGLSMYQDLPPRRPTDYEPTMQRECYVYTDLVSVHYALSYWAGNELYFSERWATFDLSSGRKLKISEAVDLSPEFLSIHSYHEVPVPSDIGQSDELFLSSYGSAIIGWKGGSAYVEPRFVKESVWKITP